MKKLLPVWLIIGVLLSGCETKETLVGQWQRPHEKLGFKRAKPVVISKGMRQQMEKPLFQAEFFKDGIFVISSAQPNGTQRSLEGRYLLSGSLVDLRVTDRVESGMHYSVDDYEPDQLSIKGRLKGGRLSLNDEYGIVMRLFSKDFSKSRNLKEYGDPMAMDFEKVNQNFRQP